jgi:DNA replication licensing factor MCM6
MSTHPQVRPELFLGTFQCLQCNQTIKGVEQHFKLTYPVICSNTTCGNRCASA